MLFVYLLQKQTLFNLTTVLYVPKKIHLIFFIFSKPTKVHNEQCLSSAHLSMIYMFNYGKIQLTIEKFKRISGHQMTTSSSSLAEFLA
jgi:hypothetical protein